MFKIKEGFEFTTNKELSYDVLDKEFIIPKGTLATVVEKEDECCFKVYFEGYGNEETDWLRMEYDEIIDCSKL